MISIIVCSVNPELARKLESNIADEIGVPYEIIIRDNRENPRSIAEVYNECAVESQFDILVFVHEDVAIQTSNWGNLVLKLFHENENLGVVGIAGAKYKSKTHSGWYTGISELDCCNVTHVDRTGKQQKIFLNPVKGNLLEQVVVIDGVFIATQKNIWEKVRFNESVLNGFHFYDLDYSFRAALICDVAVTFQLDLIHFTQGGDFGDKWIEQSFIWEATPVVKSNTPLLIKTINSEHLYYYEQKIIRTWLSFLMKQKISLKNRLKWLKQVGLLNSIKNLRSVVSFIAYPLAKNIGLIR